jgi:hypothetical protein
VHHRAGHGDPGSIRLQRDLQIIDPALKKTLDAAGRNLRDMNTAVVAVLPIYARF